jgi:hypothetical protein
VAKVYLETSFFSECCTIRKGEIARGRRATSLNWWQNHAARFDLLISNEVIRELSGPSFPEAVRNPAQGMVSNLPLLELSHDVIDVAASLVAERVMPALAVEGDALHFAAALVHGIGYLLTLNQRHLANPNKRIHLLVVCSRMGFLVPDIVTPDIMMTEQKP